MTGDEWSIGDRLRIGNDSTAESENRSAADPESPLSQGSPASDETSGRIDVTDLTVSFGDVNVLEDVSFTVNPGEFVGLVGPNGAGKTTLLRSISGALDPSAGTVTVDGVGIDDCSSKASSRLVAVVPQETTLSFSFDVRTVVEMGRHPHRGRFSPPTATDRRAVDRALDRTRTAQFEDRAINEVSGGERQRVVLARAIAQETPILVLDEPTASLDVNHQIETLELVRNLVREGRAVIAAIHDLNLAARYCDRLVMLASGTVQRAGPPADVLSAAALRTAFDVNAAVTENIVTETTTVTALPDQEPKALPDSVHVLGAGTTAAGTLARLDAAGVETSLGPVPSGSAAAETASQLGVDVIATEPFAPLSRGPRDRLDRYLDTQNVMVLADFEVSAGNQVVLDRLLEHDPLVVVESRPLAERNFAGAGARGQYEQLRERSVTVSPDRVLDALDAVSAGESAGPSPETRSDDRAAASESHPYWKDN